MRLKVGYSVLEEYIKILREVIANKDNAKDETQNLVFWLQDDGTIQLAGYSAFTVASVKTDITYDVGEDEQYVPYLFQLRFKEIVNILAAYKSLSITQPTDVYINIGQQDAIEAVVRVYEEAVDMEMDNAEAYSRGTEYTVKKTLLNEKTERAVRGLIFSEEGDLITSKALLTYLDLFLPQIAQELTENTNAIFFRDDYIYVKPTAYVTTMENNLAKKYPQFKNFKWNFQTGNFIKSVISRYETFRLRTVTGEETKRGAVRLEIEVEGLVAHITVPQIMQQFQLEPYLVDPANKFVLNKLYLTDVLRRIPANESAHFVFKADPVAGATLEIGTKKVKQTVPVLHFEGQGSFSFAIKWEFIQKMILGYFTLEEVKDAFPDEFNFNIEANEQGKLTISANDDVGLWRSKLVNLSQV